MVELHQREKCRVAARVAGESAVKTGRDSLAHEARGKAAGPFIEVADYDSRTATLTQIKYFVTNQPASLMAAFDEAGSEVNVEDVQNGAIAQEQIAAQAAATFATAPTHVVVAA